MFQSDFKVVADYFVQMRKNHNYIPKPETIEHVQETLQLLSVMAGDQRFEEAYNSANGGVKNMCEVLDRIEAKGRAEGEIIGEAKGRAEGGLNMLIGLVKDGLLSIEVAAQRANKSVEEFQKLVEKTHKSEDTSF